MKRIATAGIVTVVAVASSIAPAMASNSKHRWSKRQCSSYVKAFKHGHAHPTSGQLKGADKTLKAYGCTIKA